MLLLSTQTPCSIVAYRSCFLLPFYLYELSYTFLSVSDGEIFKRKIPHHFEKSGCLCLAVYSPPSFGTIRGLYIALQFLINSQVIEAETTRRPVIE